MAKSRSSRSRRLTESAGACRCSRSPAWRSSFAARSRPLPHGSGCTKERAGNTAADIESNARLGEEPRTIPRVQLPGTNFVHHFLAVSEFDKPQPHLVFRVFRVPPANGLKRHTTNLAGPGAASPGESSDASTPAGPRVPRPMCRKAEKVSSSPAPAASLETARGRSPRLSSRVSDRASTRNARSPNIGLPGVTGWSPYVERPKAPRLGLEPRT